MKTYIDSKGKEVKFGDIVKYAEDFKKGDAVVRYNVEVTLNEDSVDFLKSIGAITETENKKMSDLLPKYEEMIRNVISGVHNDERQHIKKLIPIDTERFFSIFPVPYISLIMNLIKQDRDTNTLGRHGYMFNIATGKIKLIETENIINADKLNIFSSLDKINECLAIVQPLLDKYYSRFITE